MTCFSAKPADWQRYRCDRSGWVDNPTDGGIREVGRTAVVSRYHSPSVIGSACSIYCCVVFSVLRREPRLMSVVRMQFANSLLSLRHVDMPTSLGCDMDFARWRGSVWSSGTCSWRCRESLNHASNMCVRRWWRNNWLRSRWQSIASCRRFTSPMAAVCWPVFAVDAHIVCCEPVCRLLCLRIRACANTGASACSPHVCTLSFSWRVSVHDDVDLDDVSTAVALKMLLN